MTTLAAYAARYPHPTDTDAPAISRSKSSADIFGRALTIAETRNYVSEGLLQARRLALLRTARHLRDQRRNREASLAEAELREVTLHILALGARE